MRIELVTPPATEPVTVAQAKAFLRVVSADEDALLGVLVAAARRHVEEVTGYALGVQTRRLVLDAFPASYTLPLPAPPLATVTSVTYLDSDGEEQTMPSEDYEVHIAGTPGAIYAPDGWPLDAASVGHASTVRPGGVRVTYTCGYSAVPEPLAVAIRQLVSHWYDNRTPVEIGASATEVPRTFQFLTAAYRFRYLNPVHYPNPVRS